ncbi:hypothetical protein [Candidatus Contendibacter odensensis]|nr:hypothetical protein [Candidatus Contendobacter odensis]
MTFVSIKHMRDGLILTAGEVLVETWIRHGRQHLSKALTLGPEQNLFQDGAMFSLCALPHGHQLKAVRGAYPTTTVELSLSCNPA